MIDLVVQRISEPDSLTGYILDGFPRTIYQAQALDLVLLNHRRQIFKVISLEVEKKKIIERITSRRVCDRCGRVYNLLADPPPANNVCPDCGGRIYQRSDDKLETIMHRMEVYEEATRPLKVYYGSQGKLIQIDGSLSIEKVHAEVVHQLQRALGKDETAARA